MSEDQKSVDLEGGMKRFDTNGAVNDGELQENKISSIHGQSLKLNIIPDTQTPLASGAPGTQITLKFVDVEYKVTLEQKASWWKPKVLGKYMNDKQVQKEILKGVSGMVCPGEMLVMLGPSGSGKTTLLNILGGRLNGKLTGTILYNDQPYTKALKRRTGFVTQDDVLFPHLTARETLVYAAMLRLPRSLSLQDKVKRAESIIAELGLDKCQDTVIGNTFLRGVSGGERKRVSIGHEMLVDPSLLLLDEPTSGLDSTTALRIVKTLQDLAKSGKTIVSTIHQPSSTAYHMFNKLILLAEGHCLYYGHGKGAMDYFTSVGFAPSFATNPADFLLDLANGVAPDDGIKNGGTLLPEVATEKIWKKQTGENQSVREELIQAYKTNLAQKVNSDVDISRAITEGKIEAKETRKWPTSWTDQFKVLLVRGWKERRHDAFALLKVGQVLVISIMCGLLWWKSSVSSVSRMQDQVGLLFFFSIFWGFYPLFTAIFTFPQERAMLVKERASGMYRLSAYFFARIVSDLPLELILPTMFVTVVYWMSGLKTTASGFFLTLLVVLYNVFVSQGLGLALGAAVMDVKRATTMASILLLAFLLAGGYYVQKTPIWIGWIKYMSFSYYSYKLQLAAQYSPDQTYPCPTGECLIADYPAVRDVGIDRLGLAVMAMAIMLVGYRLIAYFFLLRMKGIGK